MREGGQPSPLRLYTLLCVMVSFWGLNMIVSKWALAEVPGLLLALLRSVLAGVLILPAFFWDARKRGLGWMRDKPREALQVFALGLLGVTVNQTLFVIGLAHTSVAHAALLAGTAPLIVLLMAVVRKQETLSARRIAGLCLALCGALWLHKPQAGETAPALLGDALILAAVVAFATYSVFGKTLAARHGSITVNTFANCGGAIVSLPLTVWLMADFPLGKVSGRAWASLLYMALFASVLAHLIFYYALMHLPASRVTAFSYLQPVLAALLAWPLLGESLSPPVVAGGALVMAGVFMTERGG